MLLALTFPLGAAQKSSRVSLWGWLAWRLGLAQIIELSMAGRAPLPLGEVAEERQSQGRTSRNACEESVGLGREAWERCWQRDAGLRAQDLTQPMWHFFFFFPGWKEPSRLDHSHQKGTQPVSARGSHLRGAPAERAGQRWQQMGAQRGGTDGPKDGRDTGKHVLATPQKEHPKGGFPSWDGRHPTGRLRSQLE